MNRAEIEKKLIPLVEEILPPDPKRPPVSTSTRLLQDPLVDSLTIASLGFSINSTFGISTEDLVPLLPEFQTVEDALNLIEAEMAKAARP